MTHSNALPVPMLLFVYGTLKRGHCRAPMLVGQRFHGTAKTSPIYRMVNCGQYPGLVHSNDVHGSEIVGELWEVDQACLTELDVEEGLNVGLYERADVEIAGLTRHVQSYFYLGNVTSLPDCGDCWTLEFEQRVLGE